MIGKIIMGSLNRNLGGLKYQCFGSVQRWSSFVFVYSVCKSPCLVQPIGTRGWHSICVQPIASQNHSHVISKKFLGVVQGVLAPSWPPFWLIVIFYHNYIPHPMCNCFNEKNVTFTQSIGQGKWHFRDPNSWQRLFIKWRQLSLTSEIMSASW